MPIATIAIVNSNVALIAANHARAIAQCNAFMPSFKHDSASIEQMQYYAMCVQELYPSVHSDSEVIVLKLAIVLCFVGLVAGLIYGIKTKEDLSLTITWSLFGAICLPTIEVLLIGAFHAIKFLFS